MAAAAPKLIACITGANRGMGYEVSRQLAMKKWHVIMCGRNLDGLKVNPIPSFTCIAYNEYIIINRSK